jgi:cytochrome c553
VTCHARDGMGRGKFPRLVGQYTSYLRKQMDAFVKGERSHDDDEALGILSQLKEQDLQDLLAYLTSIQAVQP